MLRAAAAPERFLHRGFVQFLSETKGEHGDLRPARKPSKATKTKTKKKTSDARTNKKPTGLAKTSSAARHGVVLPWDLAQFLTALDGASIGSFTPTPPTALASFSSLLVRARRGSGAGWTRFVCLLAGAIPFGERTTETLAYFVASVPARNIVVAIGSGRAAKATLFCRGAAELAVLCSLQASASEVPYEAKPFNVADEEAILSLLDRSRSLVAALVGSEAQVRSAMRVLSRKPFDVPPPECPISTRSGVKSAVTTTRIKDTLADPRGELLLGALVEAFLREPDASVLVERFDEHAASSPDAMVREVAELLRAALALADADKKKAKTKAPKPSALVKDLARRRVVALRALQTRPKKSAASASTDDDTSSATELTRRIVDRIDELPPNAESYAAIHEREETLLALDKLGDRAVIAGELLGRALTGDANAVDMLAAMGDRSLLPHLDRLLDAEPSRVRLYEASVARMLVAIGAREARPALRRWLDENPMTGWREGLERGLLVRELVVALGELEDDASASRLLSILESTSQEYRAVLPAAAQALGRLRHAPALPSLERLLFSPKEPVTCEAVWAVGAIGQAHVATRELATSLLERLTGLEPGAEVTRLAALTKLRVASSPSNAAASKKAFGSVTDIRRAIERALWEPAFRQEETSRRRAWGLRALEELAPLVLRPSSGVEPNALFLGHEAIRHFVTRDDHRVRRAADSAFAAWSLPVPKPRMYFSFALPRLEKGGGVETLLEAVRDPLGVFRHNVATRLAEIGDPRAVRALAEATARLFAEPPTSTYEYDDAPPHLVAFVRALARLNKPESNDVLIDGLRSDNHQVRAVIAENAPDDERFVPELMTMLGDPRSFLRSRAEKSLTTLGAIERPIEPGTTEVAAIPQLHVAGRTVEG